MKSAFVNGKILDGTKDMKVQEGLVVLMENDKIVDIVPENTNISTRRISITRFRSTARTAPASRPSSPAERIISVSTITAIPVGRRTAT